LRCRAVTAQKDSSTSEMRMGSEPAKRLNANLMHTMDVVCYEGDMGCAAKRLRVLEKTINYHVNRVAKIIGARSAVQAIVWWSCELFQIGLGRKPVRTIQ